MSPKRTDPDKRFDVCVIGDVNVDLLLYGEDLTPAFGQAEKLVEDSMLTLGGSSAIFAHQAARLGLDVMFVGKVGEDFFGEYAIGCLRDAGVNTDGIVAEHGAKTGVTIHLNRRSDRGMLTHPGCISRLLPGEVDLDLMRRSRHLHVGSYFLQDGIRPALADLFDLARSSGGTTSLDPGWDPEEVWNSGLRELLRRTDYFLPNEEELTRIIGASDVDDALRKAQELPDAPAIVVKRGGEGTLAIVKGERYERESPSASVVDTTGAGDSFDAGFLLGVLDGRSMEEALELACACGALSTTAAGGVTAQPDRWRVEQELRRRSAPDIEQTTRGGTG